MVGVAWGVVVADDSGEGVRVKGSGMRVWVIVCVNDGIALSNIGLVPGIGVGKEEHLTSRKEITSMKITLRLNIGLPGASVARILFD
jgi:hypothetical protein